MKQKNSWTKAWFVLSPFVLYLIWKNITSLALFLLAGKLRQNPFWLAKLPIVAKEDVVAAVINGCSSLVAVSFLYRRFLEETTFRGEYDPDAGLWRQTLMRARTSIQAHRAKKVAFLAVPVFGGCSALAMNMLLGMIPIASEGYDRVAQIQYSVPIWLGILLYGFIAPCVEEIVFRGLLYQRMKRYFHPYLSLIVISFMFGAFHGNAVQMIYAMTLGILMTLTYEWLSSFWGPVIFHMSANLVIYIGSMLWAEWKITPLCLGILCLGTIISGYVVRQNKIF